MLGPSGCLERNLTLQTVTGPFPAASFSSPRCRLLWLRVAQPCDVCVLLPQATEWASNEDTRRSCQSKGKTEVRGHGGQGPGLEWAGGLWLWGWGKVQSAGTRPPA